MEVVTSKSKIIVDELSSSDLSILSGSNISWVFPSAYIVDEINTIITFRYPDLAIYLTRVKINQGGGDEVNVKIYVYAHASDGTKLRLVSDFCNILSQDWQIHPKWVLDLFNDLLAELQYHIEVYEATGIILTPEGRISNFDLHRLKQIGLKDILRQSRW